MTTLNTSAPAISPLTTRRIALRWQEWAPIVSLWMRSHAHRCDLTAQFQSHHSEWLSLLLARHLTMTTIRKYVLDDPCMNRSQLQRRLDEYLSTRRGR